VPATLLLIQYNCYQRSLDVSTRRPFPQSDKVSKHQRRRRHPQSRWSEWRRFDHSGKQPARSHCDPLNRRRASNKSQASACLQNTAMPRFSSGTHPQSPPEYSSGPPTNLHTAPKSPQFHVGTGWVKQQLVDSCPRQQKCLTIRKHSASSSEVEISSGFSSRLAGSLVVPFAEVSHLVQPYQKRY